jgi:hypothetical protein
VLTLNIPPGDLVRSCSLLLVPVNLSSIPGNLTYGGAVKVLWETLDSTSFEGRRGCAGGRAEGSGVVARVPRSTLPRELLALEVDTD